MTGTESINLGAGDDTLILANATNTGTVSSVETIIGGIAATTRSLSERSCSKALIGLGGGTDKLILGDFANVATVTDVETIVGGSGADTADARHRPRRSSQHRSRLGLRQADARRLRQHGLGFERRDRSSAARLRISSRSRPSCRTPPLTLAIGVDKVVLGNFVNTAIISNVESIVGGSTGDTITISTQLSDGVIDLGSGARQA